MLFLFDFDLTLVTARGRLPRQTRHALALLKAIGHELGVVTNNRLAPSMFAELGLKPIIPLSRVVCSTSRTETRAALIARWFALVHNNVVEPFYYFDDLSDQTADVARVFAGTCVGAHTVTNVQQLHVLIGHCLVLVHT